jgi:hypothetical protein
MKNRMRENDDDDDNDDNDDNDTSSRLKPKRVLGVRRGGLSRVQIS